MVMIKYFGVALAIIILIVVATNSVVGQPTFSSLCNTEQMDLTDGTTLSITKYVLGLLEVYHGSIQQSLKTAYGIPMCDYAPSNDYCNKCVTGIVNNIFQLCNYAVGAQVTSTNPNCYVRYENYYFG